MAARKQPEEYHLILGEKRDGMNYSARTYFFYTSPTGVETGLNRCPHVRILWSRGGNPEPNGTRITDMQFSSEQPICIKMVCMHTGFGLPSNRKYLYLELDPTAERIHVIGLGGFGEFTGRARINAEMSGMSMKVIRENFSIDVLAAPMVEGSSNVRSLIF
jgi:hypothetical protein